MQKVNDVSEICSQFVDCYVTTDVCELAGNPVDSGILSSLGFKDFNVILEDQKENSLYSDFEGSRNYFTSLKHLRTNLRIDCVDLFTNHEIAKGDMKKFGFVPMSKFRIYTNGSPNIKNELVAILKVLEKERMNFAFVNPNETKAFIKISEYFERTEFENYQAWLESRVI